MMIGGEKSIVDRLRPAFETLAPAPDKGWGHVGPVGAGHFVKMIHNGIEYGLMQSYAEGYELMRAKRDFGLDLHQISKVWQHGSVVRSWLLDLIALALEDDAELSDIRGYVSDSGEGRCCDQRSINSASSLSRPTIAPIDCPASAEKRSCAGSPPTTA